MPPHDVYHKWKEKWNDNVWNTLQIQMISMYLKATETFVPSNNFVVAVRGHNNDRMTERFN